MREFPFRVSIMIPTYVEEGTGRDSTIEPWGKIMTMRMNLRDIELIRRAIDITGFGISFGGFTRLASVRVADEIVRHHEKYLQLVKGNADNDGTSGPNQPVRSTEGASVG